MQWFKVAFSPTFSLSKSENGFFIVLPIREYPSSSNCPLRSGVFGIISGTEPGVTALSISFLSSSNCLLQLVFPLRLEWAVYLLISLLYEVNRIRSSISYGLLYTFFGRVLKPISLGWEWIIYNGIDVPLPLVGKLRSSISYDGGCYFDVTIPDLMLSGWGSNRAVIW